MKKCKKCKQILDESEFYVSTPHRCKRCVIKRVNNHSRKIKYWKIRYEKIKNTPKYKEQSAKKDRRKHLKRYGVNEIWYIEKVNEQNGNCAICKQPKYANNSTKSFCIDHDHKTNQLRGLLCNGCNMLLGHAHDEQQILLNAIAYLKHYSIKP